MILGHPVAGAIHETSWRRPGGNADWRVTQPFGCTGVEGEPRLGRCRHFHRGIDLGYGGCGRAILAAADGRIVYSGRLRNGEQVVVIRHADGWATSYGHLRTRTVDRRATVTRGQRIGSCGETGFAAGCHLHFAAKSNLPGTVTLADFIPNPFGGRGDSTGEWQDPWPRLEMNAGGLDADAPVASATREVEVVYPFRDYIPGSTVAVLGNTNVRKTPTLGGDAVLRTTAGSEIWTVTGFVQGDASEGSDWWLQRWADDHFEYVHRSRTGEVAEPAGDCAEEVATAIAEFQPGNVDVAAPSHRMRRRFAPQR